VAITSKFGGMLIERVVFGTTLGCVDLFCQVNSACLGVLGGLIHPLSPTLTMLLVHYPKFNDILG